MIVISEHLLVCVKHGSVREGDTNVPIKRHPTVVHGSGIPGIINEMEYKMHELL